MEFRGNFFPADECSLKCIKKCEIREDALKYIAELEEGSECIILSSFESIRIKTHKD